MPYPNTILPQLNLSTRERIERKIKGFKGETFTLKELHRLFRPRIKIDTIRWHLDHYFVPNLLVERIPPARPRDGAQYREADILSSAVASMKMSTQTGPLSFYEDLKKLAIQERMGNPFSARTHEDIALELDKTVRHVEEELYYLKLLRDCPDLWHKTTLVKRLGFLDD